MANNNIEERWKDIDGFPKYQVSDFGRVRSNYKNKNNYLLKLRLKNNGYVQVAVYNKDGKVKSKQFSVHRLVAKAFIDNPENKKMVNHKDFNKENNHYTNLEWCTQFENARHAYDGGRWPKRIHCWTCQCGKVI